MFEATAASVLADHWCAKCSTERRAERRRYQGRLKPIQDRARERGAVATVVFAVPSEKFPGADGRVVEGFLGILFGVSPVRAGEKETVFGGGGADCHRAWFLMEVAPDGSKTVAAAWHYNKEKGVSIS